MPSNWATVWPVLVSIVLFTAVVVFGTAGVRGTDQYWYVADVASLLTGNGIQTNQIFPVVLDASSSLPRPFIHNILTVWLPVIPGLILGAYGGWIAANLASSIVTAYLIYRTVRHYACHGPSAIAALGFLWLPITLWQTTQPLAEAAITPLVALAVYLFATKDDFFPRWVLLTLVTALLYYSRHSFLPILVFSPAAYLVQAPKGQPITWLKMGGLVMIAATAVALGAVLFPSYHSFSYFEYFNGTASQEPHNMWHFFWPPSSVFELSTLADKVGKAVFAQFVPTDINSLVFFWPFNLLTVTPIYLLCRADRRGHPVAWIALCLVCLHAITAVLYQNQFRYTLPFTPPLLVTAGMALDRHGQYVGRRLGLIVLFCVAATVPVHVVLAWHSRTDAQAEREVREAAATKFEQRLPSEANVMVAYGGNRSLLIGYVLRRNTVLYVDPDYSANRLSELRSKFRAQWLVADSNSPLIARTQYRESHPLSLPSPFEQLTLFQLQDMAGQAR